MEWEVTDIGQYSKKMMNKAASQQNAISKSRSCMGMDWSSGQHFANGCMQKHLKHPGIFVSFRKKAGKSVVTPSTALKG